MTDMKKILAALLCALLLTSCVKAASAGKKPSSSPRATVQPKSTEAPWTEEPVVGMAELYPLNDVFLSSCLGGQSSFSVTILPEAWKGMSLEDLTETVYQIGKRWCVENFTVARTQLSDGRVRFDIRGAEPRDGVRMFFGLNLTESEQRCLDEINALVDSFGREYSWDPLLVETAIYDWICGHMEYRSLGDFPVGDIRRITCTSAITAFREGWGNCQAYSDLFYIMASRAGLQPGYISGYAGGWHLWNFVVLEDANYQPLSYMVDVTFGDGSSSHYYLNFGLDRAYDRVWRQDLWAYGFEPVTNDNYTYYSLYSYDFGLSVNTYEEAADFLIWKGYQGYRTAEVLLKGFRGLDPDSLNAAVSAAATKSRVRAYWEYQYETMENGDTLLWFTWDSFST